MLPAASQATSVGRLNVYGSAGGTRPVESGRHLHAVDRLGTMPQHHHHASGRVELDDHVGAFVDGPDVVLRIDADGVGELEAVQPFADFANEVARLVELEQAGVLAARVDEHVALGIGRDADAFAQIKTGRQLHEVGDGFVRDFGNVLRLGFQAKLGGREFRLGEACGGAQ